ncbi:MAG: hypothetical protein LBC18_13670 [Opitutaceae bacterium]|jgi:hypothetical protein|nr:hypothetical protein [Opitutaceae bacterium]
MTKLSITILLTAALAVDMLAADTPNTGTATAPPATSAPATSAEDAAKTAVEDALVAQNAIDTAERTARQRLTPKAFARWRETKRPLREAIYAHIPALAAAKHPQAERIIFDYAHRLRDGLAPAAGAPDKAAVWDAAKSINPHRYLRSLAPRSEVEDALKGEVTDAGCDIMDVASRRIYNHGHRRHSAASSKWFDAYASRGVGAGITQGNYLGYFRHRINHTPTAEAIRLLAAEVAGLKKRYPDLDKPPHVLALIAEFEASLVTLRELEGFADEPKTSADTPKPPADALARARAAAYAGSNLPPPSPGKYSPLWFRLQRLEARHTSGENTPELTDDYAAYYRDLVAAQSTTTH